MGYVRYNANPYQNRTIDCVIRAISVLTGESWDDIFIDLSVQAFFMKDVMSANRVWESYLEQRGYEEHILPYTCPDCYTVIDFCEDFPEGRYMLATGSHVIAVIDGDYYDTWDSGDEPILYSWEKRRVRDA